jgi:hypothetical protein
MKTVELDEGKYAFDISDDGSLLDARRHGDHWASAMEWRFSKAVMGMLQRILDLEQEVQTLRAARTTRIVPQGVTDFNVKIALLAAHYGTGTASLVENTKEELEDEIERLTQKLHGGS